MLAPTTTYWVNLFVDPVPQGRTITRQGKRQIQSASPARREDTICGRVNQASLPANRAPWERTLEIRDSQRVNRVSRVDLIRMLDTRPVNSVMRELSLRSRGRQFVSHALLPPIVPKQVAAPSCHARQRPHLATVGP